MADIWPVLFSLAQVAFGAALIRHGNRVDRLLEQKQRPFDHIVCKPGDVVCVELPAGLSKAAQEQLRDFAADFGKQARVEMLFVASGIRVTAESPAGRASHVS